jgi:hypothetical protein
VFERVVSSCIEVGLVGGEGFAVDASLIEADANRQRSIPGREWKKEIDPAAARRAVKEYLATLNDAAFGAATEVEPKVVSPSDPAAQWIGALKGPAFFAYADNYLIDVQFGIIVDVEASGAIRQAEVGAARTMLERTEQCFGLKPQRLAADSAYCAAFNDALAAKNTSGLRNLSVSSASSALLPCSSISVRCRQAKPCRLSKQLVLSENRMILRFATFSPLLASSSAASSLQTLRTTDTSCSATNCPTTGWVSAATNISRRSISLYSRESSSMPCHRCQRQENESGGEKDVPCYSGLQPDRPGQCRLLIHNGLQRFRWDELHKLVVSGELVGHASQ